MRRALPLLFLIACASEPDVAAVCGDAVVDVGEVCDIGIVDEPPVCFYGETECTRCRSCQLVPGAVRFCGDGIVDPEEACDGGEACAIDCTIVREPVCGDGVVEGDETCDDTNTVTESCAYGQTSCEVCASNCTTRTVVGAFCGDLVVQPDEEDCDDGNAEIEVCPYGQSCYVCGPGCRSVPGRQTGCGDGVYQRGTEEQCDGSDVPTPSCASFGFDASDDVGCYEDCTTDVEACTLDGIAVVQEFELSHEDANSVGLISSAAMRGDAAGLAHFVHPYRGADNVIRLRHVYEIERGAWQEELVADDVSDIAVALTVEPLRFVFTRGTGDQRTLFVARPDGQGGYVETEVAAGLVANVSLAIVDGLEVIAYLRHTGSQSGRLEVVEEQPDGSYVTTQVTGYEKVAAGTSMAIAANGQPVVAFFHEDFYPRLKAATRESDGSWTVQTVDSDGGPKRRPALTRAPDGALWVGYSEYEIRYATDNGTGTWSVYAYDPGGGWEDNGVVAFTSEGYRRMSYENAGEVFVVRWQSGVAREHRVMRRRGGTRFLDNRELFVRPSGESVMLLHDPLYNRLIVASDPAR
ncbi:MAG: hypothetical protein RIT81_37085 [Deltaproteobacteria bacterium]